MADLLAIDAGFQHFGWSVFSQGSLVEADLGTNETLEFSLGVQPPNFEKVLSEIILSNQWSSPLAVIEYPKNRISTPNVDSLLKLAASCGAYTALLQAAGFSVEWVLPHEWKGHVPKQVMCKRILDKLETHEYSKVRRLKNHNVLDAVGVGLWKLKRL